MKKKYRVIVIHAPVQFIVDTEKEGEELNKEIRDRVVKVKAYPQDVMVAEVKDAPEIKEDIKEEKND